MQLGISEETIKTCEEHLGKTGGRRPNTRGNNSDEAGDAELLSLGSQAPIPNLQPIGLPDFVPRIIGSSLTTSAVSRHTFSVQAGAGSHQPRAGGGGRDNDRCVPSMSTLRAQSLSLHHDGVCTKHLFGHRRTMMTRANSRHAREPGRPINVSVTRGPTPTLAFPHIHRAYDCRARPRRQNSPLCSRNMIQRRIPSFRADATLAFANSFCATFRR